MSFNVPAALDVFSQNSDYFVTAKYEYMAGKISILIYEKKNFTLRHTITEIKMSSVGNIYISPDSQFIMACINTKLQIWKREDGDPLTYKKYKTFPKFGMSICHYKNIVAVLQHDHSFDYKICLYNINVNGADIRDTNVRSDLLYRSEHRCSEFYDFSISNKGLLAFYTGASFCILDCNNKTEIILGQPSACGGFKLCWINDILLITADLPFSIHMVHNSYIETLIHAFDFSNSVTKYIHRPIILPRRNIDEYLTLIHKSPDNATIFPTINILSFYNTRDTDHYVWLFEFDGPDIKVIKKKRFHKSRTFVPYDTNHFLMIDIRNKKVTVFDYLTPKERLEQIILCGINLELSQFREDCPRYFSKFLMRGLYDPRLFLLIADFLNE